MGPIVSPLGRLLARREPLPGRLDERKVSDHLYGRRFSSAGTRTARESAGLEGPRASGEAPRN